MGRFVVKYLHWSAKMLHFELIYGHESKNYGKEISC
jgi:hypothetical protein